MQQKHLESKALAQGSMNIIVPGFDGIPLAHRDSVAYEVTKLLHHGHTVIGGGVSKFLQAGDRLSGFMLTHYTVPARGYLPEWLQPHIEIPAVAGEARLPGVACEMGLAGGNRDVRKWLTVFGALDLETTRIALNLPMFLRTTGGVIQFTQTANVRDTRTAMWQHQQRKRT